MAAKKSWTGPRNFSGFPSHDVDNDEKGVEWIRAFAKAIWSHNQAYCPNIFYFNSDRYFTIQSYAIGDQSVDNYKSQMGISDGENNTFIDINWKPLALLTSFRNAALNKLNKVGFNIGVVPMDPLANQEKSKWYAKQLSRIKIKETIQKSNPTLADMLVDSSIRDPEDEEELEIMNSFTYQSERASRMKKLIKYIFHNNDIEEIYKEWDKDWMDFGVAVGKTDIDSNGNVLMRRVDPQCCICSPVLKRDFSDMYYFGEVRPFTIQSLRQMAQDAFDEKQYKDIAKKASGFSDSLMVARYPNTYTLPYDAQTINVLDLAFSTNWWIGPKNEESGEGMTDDRAKNGYRRKQVQIWMKCKWIIGTDYIFDYGMVDNMIRPKKSLQNARSPYRVFAPEFYNMQALSRVQRAMPIEDMICINWFKLQNELARTIPNGWAIDETSLETVIEGGQGGASDSKEDMIEYFVQTGIFKYRSSNLINGKQGDIPIKQLKGGISSDALVYYNLINMHIKTLRIILGVNDIASGEGGADRTNQQGIEMMYEASDNVLNDIIEARKWMIEKIATDVIIRAQDVLKVRKIEGYVSATGSNTTDFIAADKTLSYDLFGIKITDVPDADKKMKFEEMLNDAYSKGELDASDMFILDNMDDLGQAEKLFAYKKKAYQKKIKMMQMQATQKELMLIQQQEAIKAKAKISIVEAEAQAKALLDDKQTQNALKLQEDKYKWELKLKAMVSDASIEKEKINVQGRVAAQQSKNDGAIQTKQYEQQFAENNLGG